MPPIDLALPRAPGAARFTYERHRPEDTVLYRLVQQHAATFFAEVEAATGSGLPRFVKDEFDAFLDCGILARGFLRLRCAGCGHDRLLAFSCKRRGICPSCGARRMAQTAAHLVDHVIPHVPVRQWVLSLPIGLRLLLAAQPQWVTPLLQVVQRVVGSLVLDQVNLVRGQAQGGAVTLIQRFGSAANLNIHLHCLLLDGVYRMDDAGPVFVPAPPPTEAQVEIALQTIIGRLMKFLVRRGALVQEHGEMWLAAGDAHDAADGDEERTLRPLQAAACTYRIAWGPRAGQKVLTLQGASPREASQGELCAQSHGFSLHAAVHCGAEERGALERLCRYISRPALANERLRCNAAGQVVLRLKTPWRDGTTHVVMSPLEFMQRLAALVPRPRLHLIRYHGVLAPNAKLRARVVGRGPQAAGASAQAGEEQRRCGHRGAQRMPWVRLLKRVFEIDLARCPDCGGELRILAAILETPVIERILSHLGLQPRAPPRAPPRQMPLLAA